MKRRAFITMIGGIVVCYSFLSSSVQAIECLNAPDQSEKGWWSWREIDGRRCWYKKVGAVPPKSEFTWPENEKEAPLTDATAQQEASSPPSVEPLLSTSPHIEVVRVKPVEIRESHDRLGEGRVRLLDGFALSGSHGIGRIWETPDTNLPTDTFEARFGEWSDH